jgi:hypothetical protein
MLMTPCTIEEEKEQVALLRLNDDEVLNKKEGALRRLLQEKPRNARKMSELALLLAKKQQQHLQLIHNGIHKNKNGTGDGAAAQAEALHWAQRAIQVAPTKPYGYAALSCILLQVDDDSHLQYDRRIQALQSAIQYIAAPTRISATAMTTTTTLSTTSTTTSTTTTTTTTTAATRALWVTRLVLMVRLLLEPRVQEAFRLHKIPNHSRTSADLHLIHPSRRPLDTKENAVYQRIQADLSALEVLASSLDDDGNTASPLLLTAQQHETLAMRCDYRLGLFFRKKLPAHVYRPLARFHFQRVVARLESLTSSSLSST